MFVPTSELNPLGQIFELQFIQAWEFFQEQRFDEANAICERLVADPRVGDIHRAGCHLILAHSPYDYVHHAEQALALFKGLYVGPEYDPPDEEQKRSQDNLVQAAADVLQRARSDAEKYSPATPEESPQYSATGEIGMQNTSVRSMLEAARQPSEIFMTFPTY